MIEIKDKLEHSLSILKSDKQFECYLEQTIERLKKLYQISNLNAFHGLIRSMAMCLIVDYYISIFQPEKDQIRLLGELHLRKANLLDKIKEDQSVLTMQGKMKEHTKSENMLIISTKIAHDQLIKSKSVIGEDELFKRLNFLLNGTKISNKCYKLSLNRLAQNLPRIHKQSKLYQTRYTLNQKQNPLFKQVFLSMNDLIDEKAIKPKTLPNSTNNGNDKIKNIINKARLTINKERKKFEAFEQKEGKVQKKQMRNNSNDSLQIQLKEQLILKFNKHKQRKSSMASYSRTKNSSCLKRVGTFENERTKSRILILNEIPIQNLQGSSNQSSFESIPDVNQNWYRPENKTRTKRVFTLFLPTISDNKAS